MVSIKIRILALGLLLVLLLSGTGTVVADDNDVNDDVDFPELKITREEIGTTLGGGDFIGLHNTDRDAMMGILYGTRDNPNNVYIVSIFTRYLGTADVHTTNGKTVTRDLPIPVRTLYAQKFDTLYEFNDRSGDGVWDSRLRSNDTGIFDSGRDVSLREAVYKKVSLDTAWELSNVTEVMHENGTLEWSVKLTATDLQYRSPLIGIRVRPIQRLDRVELTFHLFVTQGAMERSDVPVYDVEVSGSADMGYDVESSRLLETRSYSGRSLSASVKFDHYFEGWDYSPLNSHPCLMMSTEVLFANGMSPKGADWMREQFPAGVRDANGAARFDTGNGTEEVDSPASGSGPGSSGSASGSGPGSSGSASGSGPGSSGGQADDESSRIYDDSSAPRAVLKNRITFRDNWQSVGELTWVSDVEVDGQSREMFFQIYRGRAFSGSTASGALFNGFALLGGFSYPGGESIFHDPSYSVDIVSLVTDARSPFIGGPIFRIICLGLIFLGVVAVLAVVAVVLLARTRSRDPLDQSAALPPKGDYYETYYMDDENGY